MSAWDLLLLIPKVNIARSFWSIRKLRRRSSSLDYAFHRCVGYSYAATYAHDTELARIDHAPGRLYTDGMRAAASGIVSMSSVELSSTKSRRSQFGVLRHVRIGQISGEHELIVRLRKELKICYSRPSARDLTQASLLSFARSYRLPVIAKGDKYLCVGKCWCFHMLKSGLPATTEIPVLLFERIKRKEIEDGFREEVVLLPAILAMNTNDKRHMGGNGNRKTMQSSSPVW